jgi:hypothetical protein
MRAVVVECGKPEIDEHKAFSHVPK